MLVEDFAAYVHTIPYDFDWNIAGQEVRDAPTIFETNSRLLLILPTTFLIERPGTGITKYPTHA